MSQVIDKNPSVSSKKRISVWIPEALVHIRHEVILRLLSSRFGPSCSGFSVTDLMANGLLAAVSQQQLVGKRLPGYDATHRSSCMFRIRVIHNVSHLGYPEKSCSSVTCDAHPLFLIVLSFHAYDQRIYIKTDCFISGKGIY